MNTRSQMESFVRLRNYFESIQDLTPQQIRAVQSRECACGSGSVQAQCAWCVLTPEEKQAVQVGPLFLQALGYQVSPDAVVC